MFTEEYRHDILLKKERIDMKALKRILIVCVVLAVVIGLTGFLILPAVLKPVLTKKISETLHRDAAIKEIKINPFALSATLRGFRLNDSGQKTSFIAFDELHVNVAFMTSLFRRSLILEEIRLDKPYIGITRREDGTYNFSDLIPQPNAKKEEKEPAKPFLFSLNNIQIRGGNIDFHDVPNKTDHAIRNLNVSVPFVSNIDYYMKNYVEPKFSAIVNGHSVNITGKTQPFQTSRDTRFDIDMKDIDIPFYLQYAPVKMNFKLAEARLDTKIQLHFIMYQDKSPELKLTGEVTLRRVTLDDLRGNKILRLPALKVTLASVEPLVPKIHLAKIAIDAPELVVRRNKAGDINLLNLVGADKKAGRADAQTKPAAPPAKKKELALRVDAFAIDRAAIDFIDEKPARTVKMSIQPLRLSVSNLSLQKGDLAGLDLAMTLDKKTDITAKGPLGIDPLAANLALDVKNLAIRPFQPYLPENILLDITRGTVSTGGDFSLGADSANKPVIKYTGNLSVNGFAAIDRIHSHDFLKFRQLAFSSLTVGVNPLFVNIREISFSDFFAKIVIHEGGSTNINDIFGGPKKEPVQTASSKPDQQPSPPDDKEKTSAPPPDIKIGKVRFGGGTVDFADRNIKPNYAVTLLNLKGSVTGLSSQEISRAKVDIKGNLGYGSPVDIAGTVNPLKKDLFADIKVSFKDIEMSPVTPYTVKFLGYPITKGKLTFNVAYLVDQRKLSAENKVFFDQLTFGERVESPEAIKAPVPLAVSLLTDRNGQINLDIPLSGSLDDPKFRIWPIVWQILVNLITKAVTSPFSLLSSLTGGGEEMSFVEFDYGSAALSEANIKKLAALSKALYDRPSLKLEIEGYVDPAGDREALKKAEFNRLVKARKLKEMMDKGQAPVPVEDITIAPAEYEKYLTLAYKAADFPKPRTALGFAKSLPPAEMEALMIKNISATDGNLAELAAKRTQVVREQLLKNGKVEAARIFLVKAPSLAPEKKDKVKDSRVAFKLK